MSKTVRNFCIFVFVVIVVLIAVLQMRSRDRSALANYKASLRAKGEKLTAEELGFPRPPDASSNLDLLIAGTGQVGRAKFDPGTLDLMRFVGPGRAAVVWSAPQVPVERTRALPSSAASAAPWAEFSAQFDNISNALELIRTATEVPPRY